MSCRTCLDAGVVEAIQDKFKTLARCYCEQGKTQIWNLESIPIQGFRTEPLDWREYRATIGTGNYIQKMALFTDRIRAAEKFWEEQTVIKENETAGEEL